MRYVEQEPPKISVFERHSTIYLEQLKACCKHTMDLIVAVTDREYAEIYRSTKKSEASR
jgi:hypothetical protein